MQDRVPLYPGRVKLTPVSGQENTYDMVRADEPTQEGTPLNKSTLLKDATASLFGLGTDAVPDDVLALLSRFHNGLGNEYIWAKERWNWEVVKSNSTKNWTLVQDNNGNRTYVRYSDNIILDNDGNISLADPITQIYPAYVSAGSLQLDNKYVQLGRDSYAEAEAKPVWFSDGVTFNGVNTYNLTYRTLETLHRRTLFGYVNSPSPDAYPPAVSDGYTYTAFGRLGAKVQIATGSYTGTGTHGSSNPNSLTFDFEPKVVFIFSSSSDSGFMIPWYWGNNMTASRFTVFYGNSVVNGSVCYGRKEGNTIHWVNTSNARQQFNNTSYTYYYIAIG